MTKQKPPKVKTKKELREWLRSMRGKNIDLKELKRAHKELKRRKIPTVTRGRFSYDKTKVLNKRSSKQNT